jgi:hypothetical protein
VNRMTHQRYARETRLAGRSTASPPRPLITCLARCSSQLINSKGTERHLSPLRLERIIIAAGGALASRATSAIGNLIQVDVPAAAKPEGGMIYGSATRNPPH